MNKKKIIGIVFILVGIINLIANYSWLHTGDIHKPQLHIVMSGGWFGFWLTTIMGAIFAGVGVFLFVTSTSRRK